MKFSKSLATLALIATLGLTACSSNNPTASTPDVTPVGGNAASAAPSSAPASEGPAKSARGNIIKTVGQPAGMFDLKTKEPTVNFTITKITVDPPCTGSYPQPATNGHFVVVDVVAETTEALGKQTWPKFDISAHNFKFVSANGTTYNGSLSSGPSYGCLADSEAFPMTGMGPAEKVSGRIALDIPETTGVLVYKDQLNQLGWEWNF